MLLCIRRAASAGTFWEGRSGCGQSFRRQSRSLTVEYRKVPCSRDTGDLPGREGRVGLLCGPQDSASAADANSHELPSSQRFSEQIRTFNEKRRVSGLAGRSVLPTPRTANSSAAPGSVIGSWGAWAIVTRSCSAPAGWHIVQEQNRGTPGGKSDALTPIFPKAWPSLSTNATRRPEMQRLCA